MSDHRAAGISSCRERAESLLEAFPGVRLALESREIPWRHGRDEARAAYEDRLGTALMALYRDTRGDPDFEALYLLARDGVLDWIKSLVARAPAHLDPQELLQDTFVNVYRYPNGFRDERPGSFRVWVRTIAGNLVRRASVARSRLSFQELPVGFQEPADIREDPTHRILRAEDERRLRGAWILFLCHYERAWRRLSPRDRCTLTLVEVDSLTYEQAGHALAVGRSNMKMIVFRARRRIAHGMRVSMAAAIAAGSFDLPGALEDLPPRLARFEPPRAVAS
jgi:RNA polymerase sigma factor (sigma-70 family)